jgi:hypothetical protein
MENLSFTSQNQRAKQQLVDGTNRKGKGWFFNILQGLKAGKISTLAKVVKYENFS